MTDTPETDMLLSNQHHDCIPYDDAAEQLADLAQTLERERDEANAARKASSADWLNQVENMSKCVVAAKKRAVCAEKERDEARAMLEQRWHEEGTPLLRMMRERDEAKKTELAAILERERWKMRAQEKWAMRRELEELLGVKGTEQEEQFATGVAALRDLVRARDEARKSGT